MDETKLFAAIKNILGKLSQTQVDVVHAILASCVKHNITDKRHIAYILATGCHECNLKPVRESIASRTGRYYNVPDKVTGKVYYGRGCPTQITLKENYETFSRLLGIDLVNNPDLALDIHNGAEIGAIGMRDGMFTGVGLSRYFNADRTDPVKARAIINGTDQAERIAGFYETIYKAIK